MRKLISITLLALFGLPFASVLLALTPKSDAKLPACCRRNGKHHCMMSIAERDQFSDHRPAFSAPLDKCPYCPAVTTGVHSSGGFAPLSAHAIYAGLLSHPAVVVQIECKRRIASERAHGKRGPPADKFFA